MSISGMHPSSHTTGSSSTRTDTRPNDDQVTLDLANKSTSISTTTHTLSGQGHSIVQQTIEEIPKQNAHETVNVTVKVAEATSTLTPMTMRRSVQQRQCNVSHTRANERRSQ